MPRLLNARTPIQDYVRAIDGDYFTRNEVCDALGLAPSTLRAWAEKDPDLGPTAYTNYGQVPVYLYTMEDVDRLRAYANEHWPVRANGLRTRKRGRPQLWSADELRARNNRRRRMLYLERRAKVVDEFLAAAHRAEAAVIREGLDVEYAERFALMTGPRMHARPTPEL